MSELSTEAKFRIESVKHLQNGDIGEEITLISIPDESLPDTEPFRKYSPSRVVAYFSSPDSVLGQYEEGQEIYISLDRY